MTMNKSARPSLYSGTSSGNTAEVFNILGVLEPPRRRGNPLRLAVLVLLAIFVGAGAFVAANNFPELRARTMMLVDSAFSGSQVSGQKVAPPAPPVSVALKQQEQQDAQASVAKIVSDEPAAPQTPGVLDLTGDTSTGLPAPSPLPELAAKSVMDAENLSSPATGSASSDKQPVAAKNTAEAPVNKPAPPKKGQTVQAARQGKTKPPHSHHAVARRKDDRDVDLIAALLTRVSASNKPEKSAKSADGSKARNAEAKPKNSPAVSSSEKPNRDLVLNQEHESLSALVRRCRTLGLVEGELCRLRICSGSWGKDPGCPASGLPPEN